MAGFAVLRLISISVSGPSRFVSNGVRWQGLDEEWRAAIASISTNLLVSGLVSGRGGSIGSFSVPPSSILSSSGVLKPLLKGSAAGDSTCATIVAARSGSSGSVPGKGSLTSICACASSPGAVEYRQSLILEGLSSCLALSIRLDASLRLGVRAVGNLDSIEPPGLDANAMSICRCTFASWKIFCMFALCPGVAFFERKSEAMLPRLRPTFGV